MKIFKKYSVLFVAILCLGIVACNNDDDEKKDKDNIENDDNDDKDNDSSVSITGIWIFDDGDGWTLTYELNADGTCKLTDTEIINGIPDTSTDVGTYVYNKKTSILTFDFDNWKDVYKVLSISSSRLSVQWYDDEVEAYTDIYVLTKQ